MNIIALDLETFFDGEYSLKKMTTESYVRDPRFEVHGVAIKDCSYPKADPRGNAWWIHDTSKLKKGLDWSQTAVLCHHAQFDGLGLSYHYDIKPAMWLDTLSMARVLIGNHVSASLDSLAKHFGLGAKTVPYDLFKGKHWHEISPEHQRQIAEGCCNDVQLTWDLFCKLSKGFPQEEFSLVDATVRMFTEPLLVGDTSRLSEIWTQERQAKRALLDEIGADRKTLGSTEGFANLLRAEGVEPETKGGKKGPIYAFAQTDDFMRDLLDDDNPRVQALAEARLAEKSNIVQTRAARLGWMAARGPMCIYLAYGAAHTTRWGGGDKLNWQNFPRDSSLGTAIQAPPDHLVVVNDASQIECRLLNMIAGQHDVIERFRNHEDIYIGIASQFYGRTITRTDAAERGTGKQLELSCGYGAGGPTIKATAKKGIYGPPVFLSDGQAMQARDLYRATHTEVVSLWRTADDIIKKLHAGLEFDWHCLHVKDKRIYLPNGLPLIYETLEWFDPRNEQISDEEAIRRVRLGHTPEYDPYWRIRTRRGYAKLYGAKLVENVIQALARLHVSQAWIRCTQAGIRMVSMEHDKLIAVVSDSEAEDALAFMKQEMCREPDWLPGIPLDSNGYISHTFAKG